MKALVITFFHVPLTGADQSGIQRRLSCFLRALHLMCYDITLLHIVPEAMIASAGPLEGLHRSQSAFWGVPLRIALAPRRTRRKTAWNYYGAGVLNAAAQPALFPHGGDAAIAVVTAHLDQQPDLVVAHRLAGMVPVLGSRRRPRRLVFDFDDIEHRVLYRKGTAAPLLPGTVAQLLHIPALFALERRAVAASDLSLVCSELDLNHLRRLGFGPAVQVIPNAVALPPAPPGVVIEQTLLFLGDAGYAPNRAAAERMARRIWPRVRALVPQARLLIAGRGSDRLPSAAEQLPGVEHLGFVDDLPALYARVRVVCCPIMVGGGTRLKLVEAAAFARPMVSTRIGAEGLDFVDGEHALLRDDDTGFAEACLALLHDDALCARLGAAGRAVMADKYDTKKVEQDLVAMIEGLGG